MDKRHWPEFGIVTVLWIRGTGLLWYYYNVFVEALAVLTCSSRSIFSARDCFGCSYFLLSLLFSRYRMFVSDHGWRCIPVSVKPDLGEFISTSLKSKAGSTAKRYKKEILKFIIVIFPGFGRCLLFPSRS